MLSLTIISCTGDPLVTGVGFDLGYAGSGNNRFHYVVRARNYTLNLADRISGLADPEIPAIVAEAEAAAQALDGVMGTFNDTPTAHHRVEQALTTAGIAARRAYDTAASYGLNPPDVPNVPYFSTTFSDVHGTP